MSHFQRLEVVGRSNETRLEVDENLNYLFNRFKGNYCNPSA